MLYNFLYPLSNDIAVLNLFKYLTFRTGGAILTSLLICFVFGSAFIRLLKKYQADGQPIRENGPESHLLSKKSTPTMGGLLIIFSLTVSTLLWSDLGNGYIWATLLITLGFGGLGFIDDYLKISKKSSKGLSGKLKLLGQTILSMISLYIIIHLSPDNLDNHLSIPFFKDIFWDMGLLFIPFVWLVIVGSSNAVNLTDGLDGLAIVPILIAASCYALIAYLVGNTVFAEYLQLHFVPNTGELAILCGAIIGAGLGFLWFNAPPAQVFMGDTGSLALGGALGVIAVITKHELVLAIIGGLFVLEAVSVIIQVASFKLTGKRVFRMAPIHHHFEKKGWSEPTVVIRFWIIALILALVGLATLKLR